MDLQPFHPSSFQSSESALSAAVYFAVLVSNMEYKTIKAKKMIFMLVFQIPKFLSPRSEDYVCLFVF